jgi:outer membrane receptor protein involved in Fe transport
MDVNDQAGRFDNSVWTPKAAVNWTVGGGLRLRGAWGKSFRVPSFAENSPQGSDFESKTKKFYGGRGIGRARTSMAGISWSSANDPKFRAMQLFTRVPP